MKNEDYKQFKNTIIHTNGQLDKKSSIFSFAKGLIAATGLVMTMGFLNDAHAYRLDYFSGSMKINDCMITFENADEIVATNANKINEIRFKKGLNGLEFAIPMGGTIASYYVEYPSEQEAREAFKKFSDLVKNCNQQKNPGVSVGVGGTGTISPTGGSEPETPYDPGSFTKK